MHEGVFNHGQDGHFGRRISKLRTHIDHQLFIATGKGRFEIKLAQKNFYSFPEFK